MGDYARSGTVPSDTRGVGDIGGALTLPVFSGGLLKGRKDEAERAASLLGAEIDRLYIRWGLEEIRGLVLDGAPATAESLIESGPEELFLEALTAVRAECGLTENERKN